MKNIIYFYIMHLLSYIIITFTLYLVYSTNYNIYDYIILSIILFISYIINDYIYITYIKVKHINSIVRWLIYSLIVYIICILLLSINIITLIIVCILTSISNYYIHTIIENPILLHKLRLDEEIIDLESENIFYECKSYRIYLKNSTGIDLENITILIKQSNRTYTTKLIKLLEKEVSFRSLRTYIQKPFIREGKYSIYIKWKGREYHIKSIYELDPRPIIIELKKIENNTLKYKLSKKRYI